MAASDSKSRSNVSCTVIYEDEHILVINKPALIHSVSQAKSDSPSVASWLRGTYPGIEMASLDKDDGGLVQRLDFETSGIIIAARTRKSWEALRLQMEEGKIEKSYSVLLEGLTEKAFEVRSWIGSRYRGSKKVTVYTTQEKRSLPAVTQFKLVRHLPDKNCSLVIASAGAARRHQVRAHASHAGHPLVGDKLYGGAGELADRLERSDLEAPPFYLHAKSVQLKHPIDGKTLCFEAPIPPWGVE